MAASQRRFKATLPTEPAWPAQDRSQDHTLRRKAAGRRRRFAMLVVVPVLLMLGSVYLNTLAAGLDARTAELEVRLDRAREVGERLEVKVAELSGAERIRALAAEKLGMHEPKSTTLKVYGVRAEDGENNGAPQETVDGGGGVRGDGTSPRREGRAHKPHGGRELQGLRRRAGRWDDPGRRADPRQHSKRRRKGTRDQPRGRP